MSRAVLRGASPSASSAVVAPSWLGGFPCTEPSKLGATKARGARSNTPALLCAALALTLSACATAPKKSASESVALPDRGGIGRSDLPSARKRSPYAPAQEDASKRGDYVAGGLFRPGERDTVPDYLPDVDAIPEPEVIDEPRSRYGNRSPYVVLGKSYTVRNGADGYVESGLASYYGNKFHGRRTSNLEVYDMYAFTAAHKTLPLPSFARVTNLDNGKSVVVRVNDRGPFHDGRVIDLSYAAAVKLGYRDKGTARVEVRGLSAGENARHDAGVLASANPREATAAPPRLPAGARIGTGKPTRLSSPPNPVPATPPGAPEPLPSSMDRLVGMLPIGAANAGERAPSPRAATTVASAGPPAAGAAASASPAAKPAPGREWRFDMQQDGKAMTADEFDAWMKSRRARVATGRAGKPDARGAAAPLPSPESAASAVAAESRGQDTVTLQVASFANPTNAGHALAMLRKADIDGARITDASINGRAMWRVRVGPIDAARAPDLAARMVAMGFDPPHRVRE